MSTRNIGSRLETLPNRIPADRSFREQIVVRSAALSERLMERERRDEFLSLFATAPRKPDAIYELAKADPRTMLPDERQRRLIHEGIRAGYITREQVIRFRATQVRDDLAQFPDAHQADDTLWCALFAEAGEMMEAQAIARAKPTHANVAHAVKETDELIGVASLVVESQRASA